MKRREEERNSLSFVCKPTFWGLSGEIAAFSILANRACVFLGVSAETREGERRNGGRNNHACKFSCAFARRSRKNSRSFVQRKYESPRVRIETETFINKLEQRNKEELLDAKNVTISLF